LLDPAPEPAKAAEPLSEAKTVVLLGAGASYGSDFKLPTMEAMLQREVVAGSRYERLIRALDLFAPPGRPVNLEELLTALDLTRAVFLDRWGRSPDVEFAALAAAARGELEDFIADRLAHDKRASRDHLELFRKLHEKDTVLSVNYDMVADYSLLEIAGRLPDGPPNHTSRLGLSYALLRQPGLTAGIPAGLTIFERNNGYFLKLHGSVSWLSCPRRACVAHHEIVEPLNERHAVQPKVGDPCRSCGTTLHRMIVAPTLVKQLDESPRMELLWHIAHRELLAAGLLIVIGVSLPPSDSRLAWLLSSTAYMRPGGYHERKLIVVNPDDGAVERTEAACRRACSWRYRSLREMLERWSDVEPA